VVVSALQLIKIVYLSLKRSQSLSELLKIWWVWRRDLPSVSAVTAQRENQGGTDSGRRTSFTTTTVLHVFMLGPANQGRFLMAGLFVLSLSVLDWEASSEGFLHVRNASDGSRASAI
jgi:hypothetical protein